MKSEGDSTAAGLKAGASASNSILLHEAAPLFLGGAVEDDADLFEGDEAAVNHFVEAGKNLLDPLSGLDDFENDGQILRETKKLIGVVDAGAAIAADAAQNRCAGKAVFTEHFDDGFVERFAVPFVGLADMDAHQGALAFKFLVWHGDSVTLIGRWCPANPEHL